MLDKNNVWIENIEESSYDFDYAYNVRYQLERALKAIEKIQYNSNEIEEYSNKCVYYHIYCDQLLDATSIIEKRFRKNKDIRINRHIHYQRLSFDFDKTKYSNIVESTNIRNTVEHNDEVTRKHIENIKRADGFNVIFNDMDDNMANTLRNSKSLIYLLDLKHNVLCASRYIDENKIKYIVNIDKLKKELLELTNRTNIIWNYVTSEFRTLSK